MRAEITSGCLRWWIQFVQFEKLAQYRIVALGHALHRSKIQRGAFVQEENAVGEFVSESHVVSDNNASELELEFEFLD